MSYLNRYTVGHPYGFIEAMLITIIKYLIQLIRKNNKIFNQFQYTMK